MDFCTPGNAPAGVTCAGVDTTYNWFKTRDLTLFGGYTHKFVDFQDMENPIHTELGDLFYD